MKNNIASFSLSAAVLVASLAFGFQPAAAPQPPAFGGSDPFLGQVVMFGGHFAPRGWAFCDGQLLQISQNSALFSILGTTYGGDGEMTFGLPDLRGRAPIGPRQGPGLSHYNIGQTGGAEQTVLSTAQLPAHTHQLLAHEGLGGNYMPTGLNIATNPRHRTFGKDANVPMSSNALAHTGAGQAHDNRQPYIGMNYIIALVGVFPSED